MIFLLLENIPKQLYLIQIQNRVLFIAYILSFLELIVYKRVACKKVGALKTLAIVECYEKQLFRNNFSIFVKELKVNLRTIKYLRFKSNLRAYQIKIFLLKS